ncbi:hypothetical protein D3C75_967570 [compost metagenome]
MKTTFIVVTHEPEVAQRMQRIFTLRDGHMITEKRGTAESEPAEGVPDSENS